VTIWEQTRFPRYLLNSLIVTVSSVTTILVVGTLAAYALARYRFRGNELIYLFFLSGLMVPLKLAIIPLFIQLTSLGLIDTQLGLILVYTAMGLPSAIFILTGFLRTLPFELEESARIDGASEGRIMWSIMLPLARPAMVIAGIHNAVPIWNDFFFPLVMVQTDRLKTLPQGLTIFMGEYNTEWGVLFAGLTLAALPITIVYMALSRQFISGLTHGAVK
jgi:raffinose/stachyose/melibiose transport system permease protein